MSGTRRDDYFAVSASGGRGIGVVLHVISGSVVELEINAGDGVAVAVPHVNSVAGVWSD